MDEKIDLDHAESRNLIKSFGKEELEDENTIEIELTAVGSSNVYFLRDKKVYLLRNHLGDHAVLSSKRNNTYDADFIKCFKALLNYSFKCLHKTEPDLAAKYNSKDFCFEVSSNFTKNSTLLYLLKNLYLALLSLNIFFSFFFFFINNIMNSFSKEIQLNFISKVISKSLI